MRKKLKRLIYKIDTILKTIFLSKKYKFNNKKVTYYFKRNKKSDVLIVVFSAFQSAKHPHYNYIQTLKKINCNQLFILDNFSKSGLGSYYLGLNGNYFIPELVEGLIIHLNKKYHFRYITLGGSSKGGSSALLHGFSYKTIKVDSIIVGSPQFRLGTYLFDHGGRKKLLEITGDDGESSKRNLDNYFEGVLKNTPQSLTVYLLDSSLEDEFHVFDCGELKKCFAKYDVKYVEFDAKYIGHKNITEPWRTYWIKTLRELYEI